MMPIPKQYCLAFGVVGRELGSKEEPALVFPSRRSTGDHVGIYAVLGACSVDVEPMDVARCRHDDEKVAATVADDDVQNASQQSGRVSRVGAVQIKVDRWSTVSRAVSTVRICPRRCTLERHPVGFRGEGCEASPIGGRAIGLCALVPRGELLHEFG